VSAGLTVDAKASIKRELVSMRRRDGSSVGLSLGKFLADLPVSGTCHHTARSLHENVLKNPVFSVSFELLS
jgi:hypothetical protein